MPSCEDDFIGWFPSRSTFASSHLPSYPPIPSLLSVSTYSLLAPFCRSNYSAKLNYSDSTRFNQILPVFSTKFFPNDNPTSERTRNNGEKQPLDSVLPAKAICLKWKRGSHMIWEPGMLWLCTKNWEGKGISGYLEKQDENQRKYGSHRTKWGSKLQIIPLWNWREIRL